MSYSGILKMIGAIVVSEGRIDAIPGVEGPFYTPIFLDIPTVIAVFQQGHKIKVETEPDNYVLVNTEIALKLMERFSISDELIKTILEEARKLQETYDTLDTIKKLADMIIAMRGVPVNELTSIELLGKAIQNIIGTGVFKNFDEVNAALEALNSDITDNITARLDAIQNGEVLADFKSVETSFANVHDAMTELKVTIDAEIDAIKNSTVFPDLLSVENKFNEVLNGEELKSFKDVEDAISIIHTQNSDTKLAEGTEDEVSASEIKANFLKVVNIGKDIADIVATVNSNKDEFEVFKSTTENLLEGILDGATLSSFKDVEDAIKEAQDSVHDQDTDLMLAKGTANEITAQTIVESFASLNEVSDTLVAQIKGILNSDKIKSFLAVETFMEGVHEQNTDTALAEGTENEITVEDIKELQRMIQLAVDAGAVIIDDNTVAAAMSKFLATAPDGLTIYLKSNKLVAKSLEGMSSSVTELNQLAGMTENVKNKIDAVVADYTAKINALTGGGGFQGYFATYTAFLNAGIVDDGIYIVGADEYNGGSTTLYRYDKLNNTRKYLGKFNIAVRDFTTNPINLLTEVTNTLPKSRLSSDFLAEIQAIKDALHDPGSDLKLASGTLAEVTAVEIRNAIDRLNYFSRQTAASLFDDSSVSSLKGWTSFKIDSMLGNFANKSDVYTKTESDDKYAQKSETHTHLNKEVLDEVDADEFDNLTYKNKLVGENLNLKTKTFDGLTYELDTLSKFFFLKDFLLSKSLIYPTETTVTVLNTSTKTSRFIIGIENTDGSDTVVLDIELEAGEDQIYSIPLYNGVYLKSENTLTLSVVVTAYSLSDYVENPDLNYHSQDTDIMLGKGTEDEVTAKYIRRHLQKLENLDESFLHSVNKDIKLAEGTTDEVAASEIRDFIDNKGLTVTLGSRQVVITTPQTFTVTSHPKNKGIVEAFEVISTDSNDVVSMVTDLTLSEASLFEGADIGRVAFDGALRLNNTLKSTVTPTVYDGGVLSVFNLPSESKYSRLVGAALDMLIATDKTKIVLDNPASRMIRFSANNSDIAKDGWVEEASINYYNDSTMVVSEANKPLKFNFSGDRITLIGTCKPERVETCVILVDGIQYTFNEYTSINRYNTQLIAITGLNPMYEHTCEVYTTGTSMDITAIDLSIGSNIMNYDETHPRTGGMLFRKGLDYYYYDTNTSTMVKVEGELSGSVYLDKGVYSLEGIDVSGYMIYLYVVSVNTDPIGVKYTVEQDPVVITFKDNIALPTTLDAIESFMIAASGDVKFVFSFDGVTWYTLINSILTPVNIASTTEVGLKANTISEFSNIGRDFWDDYISSDNKNLKLGIYISGMSSYLDYIKVITDLQAKLKRINNAEIVLNNGTANVTITDMMGKEVVIMVIK